MSLAYTHPPAMTVAEFLAWPGDGSGRRFELVDGVPRMQDPASETHGTIQSRLNILVGNHLERARPGCRIVANPGIAPRLRTNWNYREPELGVTCTPSRAGVHMLPDPILLIEVLSPSNAKDTWSNIPLYATVPSVLEMLIVGSTRVFAEILRRGLDGSWPQEPEAVAAGGTISLTSIGLALPLGEIYRDTYLAGAP